jgi:hypothetical protein
MGHSVSAWLSRANKWRKAHFSLAYEIGWAHWMPRGNHCLEALNTWGTPMNRKSLTQAQIIAIIRKAELQSYRTGK